MKSRSIAVGMLAGLALAIAPIAARAADVTGSTPQAPRAAVTARAPRSVIATAHALHTGVNPRTHARRHHRRVRRLHRAELREASAHESRGGSSPSAPIPTHPARSHGATLPHLTLNPHRAPARGGAPYALGRASLSLGLRTESVAMSGHHDDLITNPSTGVLRGRSPPRGDPPSAILLPCLERASTVNPSLLCAPSADLFRTLPSHSSPVAASALVASDAAPCVFVAPAPRRLPASLGFGGAHTTFPAVSDHIPDCAPEGGTAGFHSPSRRSFT